MGGSQNGFTLEAGVNMGRGNADGSDLVNVNTSVKAGNTAALISGGDTNIKGATVAGDTVLAYVGGDLNVASLQDTSKYDSKQNSAGLSVSLCIPPFCYGSSSASGSMSNAKVNGDFASVTEQSGIKAGDGGFQIAVSGNTDLKGAVIESTQKAIDNGRNSLLTGSLTVSSIENHDSYDATGFSVSGSVSGKAGDQSTAKKDSSDASAANSKSNPGGNAGISSESGSQSSTTVSGISGAAVTITNAAAQQALTGQTAAEVIAGLNRDVNTDKDTSGALSKSWDGNQLMQQTQAQVQITAAFGAAASKAIGDYAQAQLEEAKALREEAKKELDPAKSEAMLASAQSIDDSWGESGTSRVLAHALVGGITGGLEGAVGAAASAAVASSINHLLDSSDLPDPVKQAVGAALATATGAVVGGGAGAATAFNEDVNNRQLHFLEIELISKLAKDKAAQECNGDSACINQRVLFWSDTLERVAKGDVDDKESAKNQAYLTQLVNASIDPNSEGARGGLQNYLDALNVAQQMLAPYQGKQILVSGQAVIKDGAALSYFNATDAQRANAQTNTFLNQIPDAVAYGNTERDAARVENFRALNGGATPNYSLEEFLLGNAVTNKLLGFVAKFIAGETDVALGAIQPTSIIRVTNGEVLDQSGNVLVRQNSATGLYEVVPRPVSTVPLLSNSTGSVGGKNSAVDAVDEATVTSTTGKTINVDSKGNALVGDWSATKTLSAPENALAHWTKHSSEFPDLNNASQYVEEALNFVSNPPAGVLTKTKPNGDVMFYDPATNTFAVKTSTNAPRTMFRPTDGINYWNKQ